MKKRSSICTLLTFLMACLPAVANNVTLDLSSIAPVDAKTAPTAPSKPELRNVEIHPNDVLTVRCPAKKFPGDKGWIEYHAVLSGPGCLITTMNRDPQTESFQATGIGSQKIVVGLKQPGSDKVEQDCIVSVKVVQAVVNSTNNTSSPNVQSYAGQTVFDNKTSAVTSSTAKTYSHNDNNNRPQPDQAKPVPHNVEQQSNSRIKTY
ncbi:MAG TPA: hypothetical protein V6C97_35815 [Oculatellaceae cyanobacterium]